MNSNRAAASPLSFRISPALVSRVMTSPVLSFETSAVSGRPPESSVVLKKIGAISPPMTTPARRLFGMNGMSSPMCHISELQADFRDEPVPTTSPTKATPWPSSRNFRITA